MEFWKSLEGGGGQEGGTLKCDKADNESKIAKNVNVISECSFTTGVFKTFLHVQ